MSRIFLPEDIQRIRDFQLIERTELARADLILVFGNRENISQELADAACALYRSGLAARILVMGGVRMRQSGIEAHEIAHFLREKRIPDRVIIVEDQSRNTQENIECARRIVGDGIGSAIAVGHITASPRFLMTMARRWPEVFTMFVGVNPYGVSADEWHSHPEFFRRTLEEYDKIEGYLQRQWLATVDFDQINREVVAWKASNKSGPFRRLEAA